MRVDYRAHDAIYRRRRAEGWPGWDRGESLARTLRQLDAWIAPLRLPHGSRVLELGCGAGDLSLHLAAQGFRVFGVDIAPTAVGWAREKADERGLEIEWFTGDVTGPLELPIEPVDLVLDGHCLHCVVGSDRARALAAARRHLRPSGRLHVVTMCGDPVRDRPPLTFDPETRCVLYDDLATRYLGRPEAILGEILDAGFVIERSAVLPARDEDDQDVLLVMARIGGAPQGGAGP